MDHTDSVTGVDLLEVVAVTVTVSVVDTAVLLLAY